MMRRLAMLLTAVATLFTLNAAIALSDDSFEVIDCTISGDQIAGTKIVFPETRSGDWLVEIDRDGRTLISTGHATGYAFAHDGEPYRGYHVGVLVLEGVGKGDCETTTTTSVESTTTTFDVVTTTTQPDDTTTTTLPDVTTTTRPGIGTAEGCPAGQNQIGETDDGLALCEPTSQGG